jgi:3-oxoacyl-(acyl-carrier-protein) synthase
LTYQRHDMSKRMVSCSPNVANQFLTCVGTGTAVGDPLEASAIGSSFAAGGSKAEAVYVSSLKANFGHLEGAAGIAGLIKTCLILESGIIPPLAGLEKVNPEIDIDFLNIKVRLDLSALGLILIKLFSSHCSPLLGRVEDSAELP